MTNNNDMLSATKVTQKLNISARTLDSWYKFYQSNLDKPNGMPKLPDYVQTRPRGPRYWNPSDIKQLKKFQEWIPRGRNGVMGRINERNWAHKYRCKKEVEVNNVGE